MNLKQPQTNVPDEPSKLDSPIPGLLNITFDYFFPLNAIPPIDYPVMLPSKEIGVIRISHEESMLVIDKSHKLMEKGKSKLIKRKKHKGAVQILYTEGSWAHLDTDYNGILKYSKYFTRVQIIFPVNDLRANPALPENSKYTDDIARQIFNKFLLSYMYGINDFVLKLSEADKDDWPVIRWYRSYDFNQKHLAYLNKDKSGANLFKLIRKTKKFKIYRGYEGTNGLVSAPLGLPDYSNVKKKPTTREKLRKAMLAMALPENIDPYYELIFSAIRRSVLDKEHHLAILELATAFEIALSYTFSMYRLVLNDTPYEGNDPKELLKIVEQESEDFETNRRLYSKDPKRLDTKIVIVDGLRERYTKIAGLPFNKMYGSVELDNWLLKVWNKRSKIAHNGIKGMDAKEVSEALKLTQDLIAKIKFEKLEFREVSKKVRGKS